MNKKLVVGMISAMMFASPFVISAEVAEADTLQEMEQQKRELEQQSTELNDQIQTQESNLNNLEAEKAVLEKDVQNLQNQIDTVIVKLQEQEKKLADSIAKIETLQQEIEELKQSIALREEKLETQARAVQTDGSMSNMIDLVVASDSLSDLIGRVSVVQQLVTANKEIVVEQERDKAAVEEKELQAQEEKVAIENLKAEMEINRNNLVAQKAELDDKIVQVAQKYAMTEEQKNAFVQEQQLVATRTSQLSAEMQAERDRLIEVERQRQIAAQKAAEAAAKAAAEKAAAEAAARAAAEKAAAEAAAKAAASSSSSSNSSSSSSSSNSSSSSRTTSTSSNSYGFIRPSSGYLTSHFGNRVHPVYGDLRLHRGTDFGGGGAIVAAQSGTVLVSGYHSSWGYYVKIDHGNGFTTLYAHMVSGSLRVSAGQYVSQGQRLGIMGTTGDSTGVHLHFEMTKNGSLVNPADYL